MGGDRDFQGRGVQTKVRECQRSKATLERLGWQPCLEPRGGRRCCGRPLRGPLLLLQALDGVIRARSAVARSPPTITPASRWVSPRWSKIHHRRLQRRQRGRHPVAERRRHAGDLADGRHQRHVRRRDRPVQSGPELGDQGRRRLRQQGRHPVAERRRHASRARWPDTLLPCSSLLSPRSSAR